MQTVSQKSIIARLQRQILDLEGFKMQTAIAEGKLGLPDIEKHFPHGIFPTGTIHEFVSGSLEHSACASAFICGLLSKLHTGHGIYVWIGQRHLSFPPGFSTFGLQPHQIIFIHLPKQKDRLWATEEALKCKSLSGVISELEDITFAQSQRLQLTVEKSKVTGFILRTQAESIRATACAARWQITPTPSQNEEGLPGVGFPAWNITLLKVRNGSPTSCTAVWHNGQFNRSAQIIPYVFPAKAIGS